MTTFIKGKELGEQFFREVAKPILDQNFPDLVYTAGLLGYGSDILGYDDMISSDHMWGPRFYLFLRQEDLEQKENIMEVFSRTFPYTYRGFSVHFSKPDPNDHGVRHAEAITEGEVSPLIFISTFEEYLLEYLGAGSLDNLTLTDWLTFAEHKLLSLTCGKLFADDLRIQNELDKISFYPPEVKMYLIASNWSLAAEEQAFVKRCASVGDETGSILACARIAERLIRLAFLYCSRYAPYSKWIGTAFTELPVSEEIKNAIRAALTALSIKEREKNLVLAQKLLADLHNSLELTEPVEVQIQKYFDRDILVIFADRIAAAAAKQLAGTELAGYPLIGTLSEVANFTAISDKPEFRENVKKLYRG